MGGAIRRDILARFTPAPVAAAVAPCPSGAPVTIKVIDETIDSPYAYQDVRVKFTSGEVFDARTDHDGDVVVCPSKPSAFTCEIQDLHAMRKLRK